MDILGKVNKVPGGIMVVPMLITAVINTFAPGALKIGGPVTGAFSGYGAMAFIGALLFTAGSQAKYSDLRLICSRGGVLVVVRLLVAYIGSWLTIKFFGLDGFCGVSAMAITILLANCNPGVYMGLMQSYGDNVDKAAMGIINLIAVPATPLVILGIADGTGFDYMSAVSTLVPFTLGLVLANADEKIRKMFSTATPVVLMFVGACLGASINMKAIASRRSYPDSDTHLHLPAYHDSRRQDYTETPRLRRSRGDMPRRLRRRSSALHRREPAAVRALCRNGHRSDGGRPRRFDNSLPVHHEVDRLEVRKRRAACAARCEITSGAQLGRTSQFYLPAVSR